MNVGAKIVKQEKMLKLSTYILCSLVIIILSLVAYSLWPIQIYEQNNVVMPVLNENHFVKAGERVEFVSDFCKYYDIEGTVNKQLVNNYLYYYTPYVAKYPVGCQQIIISEVIPEFAPPGDYFLRVSFTYKINFLKTVTHTIETEHFTVENEFYDVLRDAVKEKEHNEVK